MSGRARVYANHAGTSWPKPEIVHDAVARALAAPPGQHAGMFAAVRERIAARLNIGDPAELLLTPGCTAALATALLCLRWEPDDVVLTSALEHEAMLTPIEALVRMRGVGHRRVGYRCGTPFDLDDFDELLAQQRVRVVAVTAASNVTGERLPLEAIVERARAHGCIVIIDAAQIAGVVALDVVALGADAVAFAGHKGPQGPQGIGGLWVRRGLEFATKPDYCAVGSVNLAGAAGLAAGLEWVESTEAPPQDRGVTLRSRFVEALAGRPACRVLGARGRSTGAVSITIEGLQVSQAEAAFAAAGVVVRAGRHCAPDVTRMLGHPEGTLRLSFGVTNTEDDVQTVLTAIDEIIANR